MLAALGFGAIAIAAVAAEVASEVVGELIAAVCDDNVFVLCGFALWKGLCNGLWNTPISVVKAKSRRELQNAFWSLELQNFRNQRFLNTSKFSQLRQKLS